MLSWTRIIGTFAIPPSTCPPLLSPSPSSLHSWNTEREGRSVTDFRIELGMTWGRGATRQYCGWSSAISGSLNAWDAAPITVCFVNFFYLYWFSWRLANIGRVVVDVIILVGKEKPRMDTNKVIWVWRVRTVHADHSCAYIELKLYKQWVFEYFDFLFSIKHYIPKSYWNATNLTSRVHLFGAIYQVMKKKKLFGWIRMIPARNTNKQYTSHGGKNRTLSFRDFVAIRCFEEHMNYR